MMTPSYTNEEYEDFLSYLGVDFKARIPAGDGDSKLKYYIQIALMPYGEEVVNDAMRMLFSESLENMPLYINHDIDVGREGTVLLSKIATWRMTIAR